MLPIIYYYKIYLTFYDMILIIIIFLQIPESMSYNRMDLSPNRNPYSSFFKKNNQNQPFAKIQQTSIYSSRNELPKPTHDQHRNSSQFITSSQSELTKVVFQNRQQTDTYQQGNQSDRYFINDQQLKNLQYIFNNNKPNQDLQNVRHSAQQILRQSFQKSKQYSQNKGSGIRQISSKQIDSKRQIDQNQNKRISLSEQIDFSITPRSIKSPKKSSNEIYSSGNIINVDQRQHGSRISRNPSQQSQLIKKGRYIQQLTKQLQKASKKYESLQFEYNSIKQSKTYFEQYSSNLEGELSKANQQNRQKKNHIQELIEQLNLNNKKLQQLQAFNRQLVIKVQFCQRYHGFQQTNTENIQNRQQSMSKQSQSYSQDRNIQVGQSAADQLRTDYRFEELHKKIQDYENQLEEKNEIIKQLKDIQKQLKQQISEYQRDARKSGWVSKNYRSNFSNTQNLNQLKKQILHSEQVLPPSRETEHFIKTQYEYMLRKLEDRLEVEQSQQSMERIKQSPQNSVVKTERNNFNDRKIQLLETNIQQLKAIITKLQNQAKENNIIQNKYSSSREIFQAESIVPQLKNMLQQQRNKHKQIQQQKQRLEIEVGIAQQTTTEWIKKFKQLQQLYSQVRLQQQKKYTSQQNKQTETFSAKQIQNKATSSTQIYQDKLSQQTEFQKKQIYYLENLLKNTERQLEVYRNQVRAEKQIKQKLTQKILAELSQERKQRQAMMEEYQKINLQLYQLSESYKQVNVNHEDLTQQLLGREKSRQNLIQKLQEASQEVSVLKRMLNDRDSQRQSLATILKNYQNQISQMNQKINNNETDLNKYREQSNFLRLQYNNLMNSKKQQNEGLNSYVDKQTSSNKSFGSITQQNAEYINKIKILQQNNNTLQSELKNYRNKVNQLEQKINQITKVEIKTQIQPLKNNQFSQFQLKHTKQFQSLAQKVNYLSDQLNNARNTTIPNLEKQIKQKEYKFWNLQQEVKKNKAQIMQMNEQLNDKENKIFMLSNKMTQAQQNTANNFAWLSTHKKQELEQEKKVIQELWNTKIQMKNIMMDQLRMEKYEFQNQNQALKQEKLMIIEQKEKIIKRAELYQDLYAKALQQGQTTAQNFQQYKGKLSQAFASNKPTKQGRQKLADQLGEILKINLVHFLLPPKSEKSIGSKLNVIDYQSDINIDSKTSLDIPEQVNRTVTIKQRQTIIDTLPLEKQTNFKRQINHNSIKADISNQQSNKQNSHQVVSSSISSQKQLINTFGSRKLINQNWQLANSGLNRVNSEGSMNKFNNESVHSSQNTGHFNYRKPTQGVTFTQIRSNLRKSEQVDHEIFRKTPHPIIYQLQNQKKKNISRKSNSSLERKQKIQIHITKEQRQSMSGDKQNKMHEVISPEGVIYTNKESTRYSFKQGSFNPFQSMNRPSHFIKSTIGNSEAIRSSSPINIKNSIIKPLQENPIENYNISNQKNGINYVSGSSIVSLNFNKARGSKLNDIEIVKSQKNLQSDSDSSGIYVIQKQKLNGCCFDD